MSLAITWHGHATFSIQHDGVSLVVDPFFAPNNPVAQSRVDQIAADWVLVTHGHGDHIADAAPLAKRTGATVIANFEIVNWLTKHGVQKTHGQHLGGGYRHPFGHVKMTPALHGSALPDGSYGGMPGGFLLTLGNYRVYISGDTALFSDMALIGAGGLDVAILPIGDNYTMGPDDSLAALRYLRPKLAIPCHYNTWPVITVDVDEWARRVSAETAAQPLVLSVDRPVSL